MFIRNASRLLSCYMASYPRRQCVVLFTATAVRSASPTQNMLHTASCISCVDPYRGGNGTGTLSYSSHQEIPCCYRRHPSDPILGQFTPVHIPTIHFTKIHLNIVSQTSSPASLKRSSVIRIPIKKLYTSHISLMHAKHLACLILLNVTPNNAKKG
jgi:hypothetical protein